MEGLESSSGSRSKSRKAEDCAVLVPPHISQEAAPEGLEKVQARQDHRRDKEEEEEEEEGEAAEGERQIWQLYFWDAGLRKVHLEQAQDAIFLLLLPGGCFCPEDRRRRDKTME